MENMLSALQENAKKILNSVLDLLNTTAEAICDVAGEGAKSVWAKVKTFVDENRQLVTVVAGVVGGLVVLCTVLKLLTKKKK